MTDGDVKKEVYDRTDFKGKERILCLDAKTGKQVWKHEYDCPYTVSYPAGPRCTPTVHDGKVYFLGAEGNLTCLDADKGTVVWSKDFKKDYGAKTAIWGFAGHPLVDGKKLICVVGGEGSCVVAFDKDTGKELWKALTAAEPGLLPADDHRGRRHAATAHLARDVDQRPRPGDRQEVLDRADSRPQYEMSIMTPRKDGDLLFVGRRGRRTAS